MLHAKFQNHRPSGSGEEDFLKVFAIYSHGGHLNWSCDLDHLYKLSFTLPKNIKFGFDWPSGFREEDV